MENPARATGWIWHFLIEYDGGRKIVSYIPFSPLHHRSPRKPSASSQRLPGMIESWGGGEEGFLQGIVTG